MIIINNKYNRINKLSTWAFIQFHELHELAYCIILSYVLDLLFEQMYKVPCLFLRCLVTGAHKQYVVLSPGFILVYTKRVSIRKWLVVKKNLWMSKLAIPLPTIHNMFTLYGCGFRSRISCFYFLLEPTFIYFTSSHIFCLLFWWVCMAQFQRRMRKIFIHDKQKQLLIKIMASWLWVTGPTLMLNMFIYIVYYIRTEMVHDLIIFTLSNIIPSLK